MATKTLAYDHPTYVARQVKPLTLHAAAASVAVGKFIAFTSMKIKRIDAIVNIAGTSDAAGYDVYNGTSSIGAFATGTAAVGSVQTALEPGITLTSGGYLDFKTKAESATLSGAVAIEFEIVPGANVTV